jgi:hypothetical protein
MYALFVYDSAVNCNVFAHVHPNKETLIAYSHDKFKEDSWFAIYKFDSFMRLFDSPMTFGRWFLDTKYAGKSATGSYTPMHAAYQVDLKPEWFFKNF